MNPLTTLTAGGLTRKSRKGDAEAFAELYRRHSRAIYRFALQMCGNAAIADEVTQDVFVALLKDELTFDEARGAFEPFLFGVARNVVRRHLRAKPVEDLADHDEPAAPGADVLHDLTSRESLESLRQAILTLPENYREVVVLCELEEMSYEKAAAVLGCPLGTVRSRLSRARGLLAAKLSAQAGLQGLNQKVGCVA